MDPLLQRISACSSSAGLRWLTEVLEQVAGGAPSSLVVERFPAVRRQLGPAVLPDLGGGPLHGPDDAVSVHAWTADEAGRVALLQAVAAARPQDLEDVAAAAYEQGDSSEKRAVIRSLPLLPDGSRFLGLALDAGRHTDTTLFRAVACDNPFPARHYPELEFNKLVMKAAFVGAPVERIAGLDRRANPELARMAMDYISEQEAAGRRFVPQIWLAIAPCAPAGAVGRMLGYLSHAVAEQRLWAAKGLQRAAQERTRTFLLERVELERDPAVAQALQGAVAALSPAAPRPTEREGAPS